MSEGIQGSKSAGFKKIVNHISNVVKILKPNKIQGFVNARI